MKARVKATGEIVHVGDYNTISHDPRYKDERTGPWRLEELDFNDTADYWTRLEHQYAGMAMQGLLSNQTVIEYITNCKATMERVIPHNAYRLAHALVEKCKKEERK